MTNDNSPDRKAIVILVDRDGNPWGPFEGAAPAAAWAKEKWPDQSEGPLHEGWRVLGLRHPNS